MQSRFRTLHLTLASSIAVALIVSAYVFSGPFSFRPSTVDAATAESLLKAYATKDSDSDGLSDWQESLYGTDPANPESVKAGVRDGDAVTQGLVKPRFESIKPPEPVDAATIPGSLPSDESVTAQFSQAFFKSYIEAGGQNMTAADKEALMNKVLQDFTDRSRQILISKYTAVSVHTDTTVSVQDYAGSIESILLANDVSEGNGSPIDLMDAYINNGDGNAKTKLVTLANSYTHVAKALAATHVPPSLSGPHLVLMQSFDTLSRATSLAANYKEDPVAVLGGLALFQPASLSVIAALRDVTVSILAEGEPASGAPGSIIVSFVRSTQAQ
ncbi:MAG: hypothetical protein KA104_02945 [Candidatus Pacebacteria bacterium]|nr:hypothetical protein [Candidatus Paceibacterota bacterium]